MYCPLVLSKKSYKKEYFQQSNMPANNILALKHCSAYIKNSFSDSSTAFQLRINEHE